MGVQLKRESDIMSAVDLAHYMRDQLDAVGISVREASTRSGLSRQTWHKLLQADIEEAKVSTLIKVAKVLDTHILILLSVYFQRNTVTQHAPQATPLHLH